MTATSVRRRRNPLLLTLVIFGAALLAFLVFANVWTDWLWYRSLGYGIVFTTQLATRIGLFVGFGALMGGAVGFSAWLAHRLRPKVLSEPKSPIVARMRDMFASNGQMMLLAPAVVLGTLGALSASGMVETFLAWRNGVAFGVNDAHFGMDASWFVFALPWWQFVAGFVMTTLVASTLMALVVHFTTGALSGASWRRPPMKGKGHEAAAQRHLSILAGLALLNLAVIVLLDRFALAVGRNWLFTGIAFTEHNARMPAQLIMAIIAVICAGLFFANAYLLRWSVPGISIVLMIVSALILSGIYPMLVQKLQVEPSVPNPERPYISAHIKATRHAYGLDEVDIEDYTATTTVSSGQLKADAEALPAIRLMDPEVVNQTFEQLQQVRGYYRFPSSLDIDRYVVDGTPTDAVVGARELDVSRMKDADNWSNMHTVYTHGYGLVAAYGNRRESNGEPVFLTGQIPIQGVLEKAEPRIYFGERTDQYVIVGAPKGAAPVELDTPGGGEGRTETRNTYQGSGGIPIGGWFDRLLFATRFAEINLMLSDRVNESSQIIYDRKPLDRAQKAAPWLRFDSDPYPSLVDGRMVWILDAYTTSDSFPNSQSVVWRDAISSARTDSSGRLGEQGNEVNYVRNSVKVVVDAYEGSVKLYQWDESDPVLATWMRAYPGTVTPKSEIPTDLKSHLRYPQDLFKVQRQILGRYHTSSADTWFQQSDIWEVPADPVGGRDVREPPYFLTIRWPNDKDARYSLTSVFVPKERENLSVYMAVNSDATSPDYGKLRALKLSDEKQIVGPGQTSNAIRTDSQVAEKLLPYTKGSAEARYGNLLTLPVGGGLLYVQPIYTQTNSSASYPILRYTVVRFGEHIGIGDTLQSALDQVFQGDAGASTGEGDIGAVTPPSEGDSTEQPGSTPPSPPASKAAEPQGADALLREASDELARADKAMRDGNLGEYQRLVDEAKSKIDEALKEMGR